MDQEDVTKSQLNKTMRFLSGMTMVWECSVWPTAVLNLVSPPAKQNKTMSGIADSEIGLRCSFSSFSFLSKAVFLYTSVSLTEPVCTCTVKCHGCFSDASKTNSLRGKGLANIISL